MTEKPFSALMLNHWVTGISLWLAKKLLQKSHNFTYERSNLTGKHLPNYHD